MLGFSLIFSSYGWMMQAVDQLSSLKDFSNQIINNQNFNSLDLTGAKFNNAKLTGVNFNQVDLTGADFTGAVIINTIFNNTNLSGAKFNQSSLLMVKFTGAGTGLVIKNAQFDGAKLNAVFGLVDLLNNNQTLATEVSFKKANFQNISFANIKLLDKFDFTGAVFEGAGTSFENVEFGPQALFVETQFTGEAFEPSFINNDLFPSGAYYGAQKGLSFFNVRMNGTNFSNAVFRYVNLNNMQLIDVDLTRAVFINCKIVSSLILGDLSCTKFIGSLIKANMFSNNNLINSLAVNKYTAAKLTNSNLLDYIERDPDGQISTNVFPMGIVYGRPAGLTRFDCQPQELKN